MFCQVTYETVKHFFVTVPFSHSLLNVTLSPLAGYYIYHEADNSVNGQKVRLLSPVISNGPAEICVQFYYYMYGSDSSNTLTVLAKHSSSEEQLWQKIGIQSPSWLGASVTVPIPAGQTQVGLLKNSERVLIHVFM